MDKKTEKLLFLMVDMNDIILAKCAGQVIDLKDHIIFILVFTGLISLSA
jgi:hypothetical protein